MGDYENDGGGIDPHTVLINFTLYQIGQVDAGWLEDLYALTAAQRAELDEILATQPASLLFLVNAVDQARWPLRMHAIICAGAQRSPGYETASDVRVALGVSS